MKESPGQLNGRQRGRAAGLLEGRVQFTTVQMEPRKPDRPKGTQQRGGGKSDPNEEIHGLAWEIVKAIGPGCKARST